MQSPTTSNYAVEFPTIVGVTGVSTSGVQWIRLTLGKPTFMIMVSPLPGKFWKFFLKWSFATDSLRSHIRTSILSSKPSTFFQDLFVLQLARYRGSTRVF